MVTNQLPLKTAFAIGTGLIVLGFVFFLQSLGSGGGVFSLSLMLIGAICSVASIVLAIIRASAEAAAFRVVAFASNYRWRILESTETFSGYMPDFDG